MGGIEKEQKERKVVSIFLIYLNKIIRTSTFAGIFFVDKIIFFFFEQGKLNSYKTAIKALN